MDPAIRDLLMEALNAAKLAGASYADVRIGRQREQCHRHPGGSHPVRL